MFKFVITIFLMKSSFVMSSYYGSEDQRSSFIITTDDHKLVGQTIHKRKATDVFDCALCLIGDQCKSFNFNEESGDCYLNGRRAKDKELVQAYGFIYGEKNPCEAKPCQNGGECSVDDNKQGYQCKCKTGFKGNNCQVTCPIPVGMESGKIPDSSITASPHVHDSLHSYYPGQARLNNKKGRCWMPSSISKGEWLQVDIGKVYTITGIATQGNPRLPVWVKNYKVRYDSTTINPASPLAESGKTIPGNKDHYSIVKHTFNPSFDARYVRILPQEWEHRISLRIEIYVGC